MYCPHCGSENEAGRNFCLNCGRPLPRFDKPPLPGQAAVPFDPFQKRKIPRRSRIIYVIAGLVGLSLLAAVALFLWLLKGIDSRLPEKIWVQYLTEDGIEGSYVFFLEGGENGPEAPVKLNGFPLLSSQGYLTSLRSQIFSPDGNSIVLCSRPDQDEQSMLLYNLEVNASEGFPYASVPLNSGTGSIYWNKYFCYSQLASSFSSDGNWFAYTEFGIDGQSESFFTRVLDRSGETVLRLPEVIFKAFVPSASSLIGYEFPNINENASTYQGRIVLVEIPDGRTTILYEFEVSQITLVGTIWNPITFIPAEAAFYFAAENRLQRLSLNGGQPSELYRANTGSFLLSYSRLKDGRLLLLELAESDSGSEIYRLIEVDEPSGKREVITSELIHSLWERLDFEYLSTRMISTSSDGRKVAYVSSGQGDRDQLEVVNLENHSSQVVCQSSQPIAFELSPKGERLALLEFPEGSGHQGGELFIVDVASSQRFRVDMNVYSFKVLKSGTGIVYSRLLDESRDSPRSELIMLDARGLNPRTLAGPEEGIYFLLP